MSQTLTKTTRITATYRIVTPMFCSGANADTAELRLHSYKGALRYWWRSIMHGRVGSSQELQQKEAAIFGAANDHGQSKVRLRIVESKTKLKPQVNKGQQLAGGRLKGANYFGYGVLEAFGSKNKGTSAGELTRPMIPGGEFTIEVSLSPAINAVSAKSIRDAMVLLGTVGGLGSKSRKGYGSLTLTSLEGDGEDVVFTPESLLNSTISQFPEATPDWNAWSRKSRVVIVESPGTNDPLALLDHVGCEQIHFRSWGHNGSVLGLDREANFKRDHDMSKQPRDFGEPPDRIAFGLPHSYGKGDSNGVKPQNHDRRGSSLFIHIHQASDESTPVAVISFLPSRILPEGERMKAFGNSMGFAKGDEFWYPVHAFLDRLVGDGNKPDVPRPGYKKFPTESTWWKKRTNLQGKEVQLG